MSSAMLRPLRLRHGKSLYLNYILQSNLPTDKSIRKLAYHSFKYHK
jgi:hypothetical protein